jgi:hypothetical protein
VQQDFPGSLLSGMQDFSQPHEFRQDHRINKGKTKLRRVIDVVAPKDDFAMERKDAQEYPDVDDGYGELSQFVESALFPPSFSCVHHGDRPFVESRCGAVV